MNFLYLQNRYRKKKFSKKKKSLTFDHQKDEHYQLYEKGFYSFFHPWRLFSCTFGHKNDDVRQGLSLQGFTLKFPLRSLYTCRKVEWSKVTTAMLMLGLKKEPFQGNFSLLSFFSSSSGKWLLLYSHHTNATKRRRGHSIYLIKWGVPLLTQPDIIGEVDFDKYPVDLTRKVSAPPPSENI